MRALLGQILRDLGFDVLEAGDGREGLEILRKHRARWPIELALVDWHMPRMDGLAFVQAVRADPELADIRLVMVSTETELRQIARVLEAGADEYVMKPFTRDVILEKLALLGITFS
jgi:two-component system chemotaxis response regulator CheY